MPAKTLTLYIDYKSPYAYLAKDLAYQLERDLPVRLDWRPYVLDIPKFLGSARVDADGRVLERGPETFLGFEELGFGPPSLRDVARVQDDSFDRGVVDEVGADCLEHAPIAVAVEDVELEHGRYRAGAGQRA